MIEVRRAKPEDVPAVVEFTRNTWEWGDYVHREFGRWVSEGTDICLVASHCLTAQS